MASYIEKAEGKDFLDLIDDKDFQKDLARFFSSTRYNMTLEDMKKEGIEGLGRKFVEHMRYQETNEATTAMDYFFVQDKENNREEDLAAFGRLMSAWDTSEGGGTGFLTGAGDYAAAIATSPSTLLTLGTAGFGILSKGGAYAAKKGTQIALRSQISDLIKRGVTAESLKASTKGALLKGAGASAVVEGTLGAYTAKVGGEVREEVIPGYEINPVDVAVAAGISGAFGGVLGGAARYLDVKQRNSNIDTLYQQALRSRASEADAVKKALKKLEGVKGTKNLTKAVNDLTDTIMSLVDHGKQTALDPLPKDKVELGRYLRENLLKESVDTQLTTTLSMDTIRRVSAAYVDIAEKVKLGDNERITAGVARALDEGLVDMADIKKTYGLSGTELGYIWLSAFSDAGRTLQQASKIKKAVSDNSFQKAYEAVLKDIEKLASEGISGADDVQAANFSKKLLEGSDFSLIKTLREADGLRISMMTSQLTTTMANIGASTARLGVDMSDQLFRNLITKGRVLLGDKDVKISPFNNVFTTLKGMTWNREQARLASLMLREDIPAEFEKLFYETTRVENATGSQSWMAKTGRFVNTLNDASDAIFKQAVFYSSLERSLARVNNPALGRSFAEFSKTHSTLEDMPEDILKRAINDAMDFTYQKTYRGDDTLYAKGARAVIEAHKKIPFLVSSQIPFPRYTANHLEFIHDYTPIGFATAAWDKYIKAIDSPFKNQEDRMVRGFTGLAMLAGAYMFRSSQGTDTRYNQYVDESGNVKNLERIAGPINAHLFIADLIYRWRNDKPMPDKKDVMTELADITVGLGELGYNKGTIDAITESIDKGSFQPMQKILADLVATFTYPTAIVRDYVGQHNPLASYSDYTKNATGESNFLDAIGMVGAEFVNRSARFLPDWEFLQYTQSLNGKNDMPLYRFTNPNPVGTINPFMKQLTGLDTQAPLTELEKELNRLALKEWVIYKTTTVKNPSTDFVVRKRLSQTLYKEFEEWRTVKREAWGGVSYDELSRESDKERELKLWLNMRIRQEEELVEDSFHQFIGSKPRAAAGFVRNMYTIKEKELISFTKDKNIYNSAVYAFTGGEYESADQYIAEGLEESIPQEVARRMQVMQWAASIAGKE